MEKTGPIKEAVFGHLYKGGPAAFGRRSPQFPAIGRATRGINTSSTNSRVSAGHHQKLHIRGSKLPKQLDVKGTNTALCSAAPDNQKPQKPAPSPDRPNQRWARQENLCFHSSPQLQNPEEIHQNKPKTIRMEKEESIQDASQAEEWKPAKGRSEKNHRQTTDSGSEGEPPPCTAKSVAHC